MTLLDKESYGFHLENKKIDCTCDHRPAICTEGATCNYKLYVQNWNESVQILHLCEGWVTM